MKTLTEKAKQETTRSEKPQVDQAVQRPSVEEVLSAIRLDSGQDALKYVLRSDTSHDGE